jgi:hypothetical protein
MHLPRASQEAHQVECLALLEEWVVVCMELEVLLIPMSAFGDPEVIAALPEGTISLK